MFCNYIFTFILLFVSVTFASDSASSSPKETYLILNMENEAVLPRNFRISNDFVTIMSEDAPSILGFTELNISGSGQFSRDSLKTMIETIPNWNITIVDLREEPHCFLNHMAITWYSKNNWTNQGLSLEQIELDEMERVLLLQQTPEALVYTDKHQADSFTLAPETVETERDVATYFGLGYVRIPATDHMRPSDKSVDAFVELVKAMEPGAWLHMHCSAGRGRTTTFMTLFDMMKNAGKVSLEDIVKRQHLLGGLDLFDLSNGDEWKIPHKKARAELVKDFYRYCQEVPDFSVSWSEWLSNQM